MYSNSMVQSNGKFRRYFFPLPTSCVICKIFRKLVRFEKSKMKPFSYKKIAYSWSMLP